VLAAGASDSQKAGVRDLQIDDVKVTAADRMDVIAQDKAN